MKADLMLRNIVIVGVIDVNLFDKYFFIKHNIFKEEEILPNSIFANTQGIIQIFTPKIHILLNNAQLILTANYPSDKDGLDEIAIAILRAGSFQNIIGLGINFHWYLSDNSKSIEQISKDYFYNDKIEILSKHFNKSDTAYGLYVSSDVKDSRLKLDIKPSKLEIVGKNLVQNLINFTFNFHFDKSENITFEKYLGDYNFYREESEKIVSTYKK